MAQELERTTNSGNLPAEQRFDLSANNPSLSHLSEAEIAELQRQHISSMIDMRKKAEEMKIDVGALDAILNSATDTATKATQGGAHATISHTQTTSVGRTEVVIGNTDRAKAAKLSASAAGVSDRLPWIVGIIAVAAVIIALIAFHH
jgi:hypothetical protein